MLQEFTYKRDVYISAITLCVLVFCFFVHPAKGATMPQQLESSDTSFGSPAWGTSNYGFQELGNGFSGTIEKITFITKRQSGCNYFSISAFSDSNYTNAVESVPTTLKINGNAEYNGQCGSADPAYVELDIDPSYTFNTNYYYRMSFDSGDVSRAWFFYGKNGSYPERFRAGQYAYCSGGEGGCYTTSYNFKAYFAGGYTPDPTATFFVDYPTSVSNTDFTYFKVSGNLYVPYAPQKYFQYKVDWGTSSTTFQYTDVQNEIKLVATTTVEIANVPKTHLLSPNTTYYARGRLFIGGNDGITWEQVATSSVIFFQTGTTTIYDNIYDYVRPNFSTSTAMFDNSQWSCPVSLFGADLFDVCAIAEYLFVPSQSDLDKFSGLTTALSTKAPFAYFYDLQTVYNNAVVDGGSDNFPSISINTASSSVPINVVIFSTSTIERFAGNSNVVLFRLLIGYSLWLGFAYFVYYEIRNFRRKREGGEDI